MLIDRKSTRLNSSHLGISYAVFCLKKKTAIMTRVKVTTGHGAGRRSGLATPQGHTYTRAGTIPLSAKATSRHSCLGLFFFNDTATTEIYTLSLHDALPI